MFRDKRVADHELRLASLALAVAELRKEREASTPAEIFKLIEALQADIDAVRISLRSLHGKVAAMKTVAARDEPRSNDELDELLAFQHAHGSN